MTGLIEGKDRAPWMEGYAAVRGLGDGEYLCLMKLTLGRFRLIVATEEGPGEHW